MDGSDRSSFQSERLFSQYLAILREAALANDHVRSANLTKKCYFGYVSLKRSQKSQMRSYKSCASPINIT